MYPFAAAVSADGNTIAGGYRVGSVRRAIIWTQASGATDIGTLGGADANVAGISGDGRIVTGTSKVLPSANRQHAFRWTAEDGMQDLGALSWEYYSSFANAISDDGNSIVGWSYRSGISDTLASGFRWTPSTRMRELSSGIGGYSFAIDVSADGSVICGAVELEWNGDSFACVWKSGSYRTLYAPGSAVASAVSANGVVVAGVYEDNSSSEYHLFRWTEAEGVTSLGSLGSRGYGDIDISEDGSVLISYISTDSWFPIVWTEELGIRNLNDYLRQIGVDLDGGEIAYATDMTPDATVIVGEAYRNGRSQTFRITNMTYDRPDCSIDYNGEGDSGDMTDLLDFLGDFGACELQPAPCGSTGNVDYNEDGFVDILDFLDFIDAFSIGC